MRETVGNKEIIKEWYEFLKLNGAIEYNQAILESYFRTGTYLCEKDSKGIMFLCLFSIFGDCAEIDELTIRPDHRKNYMIRYVAIKGLRKFPFLSHIAYERLRKYPDKARIVYDIYSFIGVKGVKYGKEI